MKTLCVGVVAEKGAGKGHFVDITKRLFPQKHIDSIRFSDPLRTILTILNREVSRTNMQTLATALRQSFNDDGILNDAMRKYITETHAGIVLLDGIRKSEEARLVCELGGTLVYIKADRHIRYERRRLSAENTDERNMTWEQFLVQENAATETSIRTIGENMAHITIENNGTIQEFENQIKRVWFVLDR